jgi:hypothetical protein
MKIDHCLPAFSLAGGLLALAIAPAFSADYPTTVSSFKPSGYWRLNETAPIPAPDWATNRGTLGSSAYGYYQTGVAHPVTPGALVAQPNDGAAAFSGNKVAIPYKPGLNPSGPFTVECWAFKTAGTGYPLGVMASLSATVNRQGWLVYDNGSSWTFRMGSSAGYVAQLTGGTATEGAWAQVAGVYDGTNAILYVNGVAVASVALSGPYEPNPDYETQIGTAANSAFTRNFAGSVDEVAFYTNALSADELLAHYQNGINPAPTTAYQDLILAQHPFAYYRLDEPSYLPPDPSTLPVASNSGSLAALANGTAYPGLSDGAPAAPYSGFDSGNTAYLFDGLAGYVNLGNPDGLNFEGNITMMAWIKPQATDGLRDIVAHGYTSSPDAEVGMRINSGKYELWSWDNTASTGNALFTMPAGDLGRWTFLAGTYDGKQWNLFWNGLLVATNVAPLGALTVFENWAIGAAGSGTERFFRGGIDEVAIFTNALTTAQVQQVFNSANVSPIIGQQPVAPQGTVYEGSAVTFSVMAAGSPTLAYQWTRNGVALGGKTTSSLAINSALTSDSGDYALVITNSFGSVTSSIVALSVLAGPPLIIQQPAAATRYVGGTAKFSVTVGGSVPYAYQWMLNGTNVVAGATSSSYTLSPVQPAQAGSYSCIVTNPYGSSNSMEAVMTVLPVPSGYPGAIVGNNPVGYWRLGEAAGTVASDYWGGNDGKYTNTTLGLPGYSALDTNTAAGFNGANSAVLNSQGLLNNLTQFTVCGWIMRGTAHSVRGGYFGQNDLLEFGDAGGGTQIEAWIDKTGGNIIVSYPWADNEWGFIALTADGTTCTMYTNGVPAGTRTSTVTSYGTNQFKFNIGGGGIFNDPAANWDPFLGSIDEVAVFNKALSDAQIQAMFAARYGATTPPLVRVAPASVTNYAGLTATFSVVAEGSEPVSYQWQKGTTDLPGEIYPTLTISPLDLSTGGTYRVVLNNGAGTTNVSANLTVLPVPATINLSQNLMLHLPFDGNYLDSSGRNNNATKKGNPSFVAGQIGSGAVHVNVDSSANAFNYVQVTNSPDLAFGANDSFTVSFWANYTSWPNDDPMIGNAVGSTYQLGWILCDYTSKIECSLASTANSGTYIQAPLPNSPQTDDGTWHNVVMIVDRSSQLASVYVDATLAGSWSVFGLGTLYYNQPVTIGNDPGGTYGVTGGGNIDDLGIWRRALSPLEAAGIYLVGASNHVSFVVNTVTLSYQRVGNQLQLTWPSGTLQSADAAAGPYADITPTAGSPYPVNTTGTQKYYRVRVQ